MARVKVGDRVVIARDTEVEEQKRTGIWHMPFCAPRHIGKKGTVEKVEGNRWSGQNDVYVRMDGDASHVLWLLEEKDLDII